MKILNRKTKEWQNLNPGDCLEVGDLFVSSDGSIKGLVVEITPTTLHIGVEGHFQFGGREFVLPEQFIEIEAEILNG